MSVRSKTKTLPDKNELAQQMIQRVLSENVVSFNQARLEWERITGFRVDRSTFMRWHRKGVQGIRLDACRFSREYLTSVEALNRFINARTAAGL